MDEKQTREQLIDKQLVTAGWLKKYVKEEVNTIRSNFNTKEYVLSEGRDDDSGRFMDYLLLAEDNSPVAFIEAKNFSKSEDVGRAQARTYLRDVQKQTSEKIPYFLTNGNKWLFIDQDGIERHASGVFSQSDLKRRLELYRKRRDPTKINISNIVDRPRSILIVKQMMEHVHNGKRTGLISMATGTGKTRVAMGMIDLLLKANIVRNVLFIADRIALANQAKSAGFKEFFQEAVVDLRENPKSFPNGLYVSTVQTLRSGKQKKVFERFSPGFFDLIIFDEAHRSIYDPNRLLHKYFDAIRIGLTATPSKEETKNTFKLFGCKGNKALVEYKSDEGKPAKTIFFCANVAHAKHIKRIFNRLDPRLSNDVQIIISEIYRYTDEISRFKLDSEPRIALSVGVLDTGVDIPEVCNLVFVKPVFSGIRFWQMLGRGTRNLRACKHKDWLPNNDKQDFLILDFTIGGHSNVKYHHLQEAKERKASADTLTRIFLNRVELLKKRINDKQKS